MRKVNLTQSLAGLLFLVSAVVVGADPEVAGPKARVQNAIGDILRILEEGQTDSELRWQRIGRVIDANFDFQSMSQSVLAANWRKASGEERRQFVDFFSQYLEDTYRTKIEAYTDQKIEYAGEKISGDRALVSTFIITGSAKIPVNYKLRLNEREWLAYDVEIEGVSLINSYRDTFSAIVKNEGMEGLLSDLERRIARHR